MLDLRASLNAASAAGALRRVSFRPDAANDFMHSFGNGVLNLLSGELEGFKKASQSINQSTFVVVVAVVIVIVIIIMIIIVRRHLGSSVRVACEGRLLTNDVRGFTNRDVDCNMVSRVLFRGHLIP